MSTDPNLPHKMDSEKSIYLDREEHHHRGNVGAKRVVLYTYDANSDELNPYTGASPYYATKITVVGAVTYIGRATPGSSEASAVWQAQKVDETSGTVITWADGDALFNNIATDLAALSYS